MVRTATRRVIWSAVALLASAVLAPGAGAVDGDFVLLLGGIGFEQARAVVRDPAGNVYVAGETFSSDLSTTPGAFQPSFAGGMDGFVAKISANGSAVLGTTFLGGSGRDEILTIALDDDGYVYCAGTTDSADFPTSSGAYDSSVSSIDAFVAKLTPDLGDIVYATFLGGSSIDEALSIAVDSDGSAYVAGETLSADFPTTPGAFDRTNHGGWDAFAAKLDPTGTALAYSTYLGGGFFDAGDAIAIDSTGAAYVAGFTGSTDFPITEGAFQPQLAGSTDAFLLKLAPAGDSIVFGTFLGGVSSEETWSLQLLPDGSVYLAGQTSSSGFPTTVGALDRSYDGFGDAFFARLDSDGSGLLYGSYLGGLGADAATSIAVDPSGSVYLVGFTSSPDFPTRPRAIDPSYGGEGDAFLAKVSPDGAALVHATFLGGIDSDLADSVAVDASGAAIVGGGTNSTDFPATAGSAGPFYQGGGDAFLARLTFSDEPSPWTPLVVGSLAVAAAVAVAVALLFLRRRRARGASRPPRS